MINLPAVQTFPRITSDTSSGLTFARFNASWIATAPSSYAASVDKLPLNEPSQQTKQVFYKNNITNEVRFCLRELALMGSNMFIEVEPDVLENFQ